MYNQKMVCCLKANGKVLREFKDTVYAPFGSEYSILIKNLNSVRAIVNIQIDGTDAVPGGLVVNAMQEIDLERFVKDMSRGNKFKFIQRSEAVEAGRGIETEDGLIRVSFKYAKPTLPPVFWGQSTSIPSTWPNYPSGYRGITQPWPLNGTVHGATLNSVSQHDGLTCSATTDSVNVTTSSILRSNDIGITVPGSLSEQKFQTVAEFATEDEEHVIVLRILGETETTKVSEPITVTHKPKCVTCGRVNRAKSSFCATCGTALKIFG